MDRPSETLAHNAKPPASTPGDAPPARPRSISGMPPSITAMPYAVTRRSPLIRRCVPGSMRPSHPGSDARSPVTLRRPPSDAASWFDRLRSAGATCLSSSTAAPYVEWQSAGHIKQWEFETMVRSVRNAGRLRSRFRQVRAICGHRAGASEAVMVVAEIGSECSIDEGRGGRVAKRG